LTQFIDFGLSQPVLKALEEVGYTTPTPIQAQTIAPAMEGRDICGIAQTGTGKTAAFALPILHRLSLKRTRAPRRGCRVLVLSPTRELANQIAENFAEYGRHLPLTSTVVFGGVTISRQERALANGVDILVATPHRSRRSPLAHAGRRRDPRPRRGRPDARSRLHPRSQAHREDAAAGAPEPVLLGHHAEEHRRSRRAVPA
jgi:ATP-dependent helicase YprA (DUF1998 family)